MVEVPELDRKINACLYRHDSPGARAILLLALLDAVFFSLSFSHVCHALSCPEDEMHALWRGWSRRCCCCSQFVLSLSSRVGEGLCRVSWMLLIDWLSNKQSKKKFWNRGPRVRVEYCIWTCGSQPKVVFPYMCWQEHRVDTILLKLFSSWKINISIWFRYMWLNSKASWPLWPPTHLFVISTEGDQVWLMNTVTSTINHLIPWIMEALNCYLTLNLCCYIMISKHLEKID